MYSKNRYIQNLADLAIDKINYPHKVNLPDRTVVQLVLPYRKTWAKTRFLDGRGSPRGEYVDCCEDGEIVNFDAYDILAYCVANGAKGTVIIGGQSIDLAELANQTTAPAD